MQHLLHTVNMVITWKREKIFGIWKYVSAKYFPKITKFYFYLESSLKPKKQMLSIYKITNWWHMREKCYIYKNENLYLWPTKWNEEDNNGQVNCLVNG